jgi:hypothetical protein
MCWLPSHNRQDFSTITVAIMHQPASVVKIIWENIIFSASSTEEREKSACAFACRIKITVTIAATAIVGGDNNCTKVKRVDLCSHAPPLPTPPLHAPQPQARLAPPLMLRLGLHLLSGSGSGRTCTSPQVQAFLAPPLSMHLPLRLRLGLHCLSSSD